MAYIKILTYLGIGIPTKCEWRMCMTEHVKCVDIYETV